MNFLNRIRDEFGERFGRTKSIVRKNVDIDKKDDSVLTEFLMDEHRLVSIEIRLEGEMREHQRMFKYLHREKEVLAERLEDQSEKLNPSQKKIIASQILEVDAQIEVLEKQVIEEAVQGEGVLKRLKIDKRRIERIVKREEKLTEEERRTIIKFLKEAQKRGRRG